MKNSETSIFKHNDASHEINVISITPAKLGRLFKIKNIEKQQLQDDHKNIHQIINEQFHPKLKAGTTYFIADSFSHPQSAALKHLDETERLDTKLEKVDQSQSNIADHDNGEIQELEKNQKQAFTDSKKQEKNEHHALSFQEDQRYFKSRKMFIENLANGCNAVEELVLLSITAPDLDLFDDRSFRVSLCEAIPFLTESYNEAANVINEINLRFSQNFDIINHALKAFSAHKNTNLYLHKIEEVVKACITLLESKNQLFESTRLEYIGLEQAANHAEIHEKLTIESERKMQFSAQNELTQLKSDLYQKQNEVKTMETIIQDTGVEIKTMERNIQRANEARPGFFEMLGLSNPSDAEQKRLQELEKQHRSAKNQKHLLLNEIEEMEHKKIKLEHKIKNAKTVSSTNWKEIYNSLKNIISAIEEISNTWNSLVSVVRAFECDVKEFQNILKLNEKHVDNSNLIKAALHVSLNSWIICQCCEIFDGIVRSHIIPVISGITSNFALTAAEASAKLSKEKSKSKNIRNEAMEEAEEKFSKVLKAFVTVEAETKNTFAAIFYNTF